MTFPRGKGVSGASYLVEFGETSVRSLGLQRAPIPLGPHLHGNDL